MKLSFFFKEKKNEIELCPYSLICSPELILKSFVHRTSSTGSNFVSPLCVSESTTILSSRLSKKKYINNQIPLFYFHFLLLFLFILHHHHHLHAIFIFQDQFLFPFNNNSLTANNHHSFFFQQHYPNVKPNMQIKLLCFSITPIPFPNLLGLYI